MTEKLDVCGSSNISSRVRRANIIELLYVIYYTEMCNMLELVYVRVFT